MSQRRCPTCTQRYQGAYHRNCPGTPALQPVQFTAVDAPPLVTLLPPQPSAAALPQAADAPGPAVPARQRGVPAPATRAQPSQPLAEGLTVEPQPVAASRSSLASQPMIGATRAVGRRQCVVIARYPAEAQRPVNNAAIAAMLGVFLLLYAFMAAMPCLVMLAFLGIFMARRRFYQLVFPRGRVTTWNYELFDTQRGTSFDAIIFDATGVSPNAQALVEVRGRQQRNYFRATRILRIIQIDGTVVQTGEGLMARQIPPVWLGGVLLAAGVVLNLLRWVG